ncbi:HD domain-containing protein [Extensimonas sp. H3M7-6]|uniref:HD domain-containing protein n=1 Tax=Extensimonas soli TaxID=3031322 RepID=UPI0023DCD8A1|nr:HD domain-containing protein [Extensimonas sp. H3M7-6]MDF1482018.1 HD domain-containing protein [Extensimonas sp. H3M7-6]
MTITIDDAMEIAVQAYSGKKDKAGKPYILHALRVMLNLEESGDEELMVAGLLHDVIEDTEIDEVQLLEFGLSDRTVELIKAVSRKRHETYEEFIERIAQNRSAARIKIADIKDNINLLRMSTIDEATIRRTRKYMAAWLRLKEVFAE